MLSHASFEFEFHDIFGSGEQLSCTFFLKKERQAVFISFFLSFFFFGAGHFDFEILHCK